MKIISYIHNHSFYSRNKSSNGRNNAPILTKLVLLKKIALEEKLSLEEYDLASKPNVDVLLIFSPIIIHGYHIYINDLWRRYLHQNSSNTKLIIAGVGKCEHPNYFDLFTREKTLSSIIDNALSISSFKMGKLEGNNFFDDWHTNSLCQIKGNCLDSQIESMLYGHESEMNLVYQRIKFTYQILKRRILENSTESHEIVCANYLFEEQARKDIQFLKQVCRRWKAVTPILKFSPFNQEMEKCLKLLIEIIAFFDTPPKTKKLFISSTMEKRMKEFCDTLDREVLPLTGLDHFNKRFPNNFYAHV